MYHFRMMQFSEYYVINNITAKRVKGFFLYFKTNVNFVRKNLVYDRSK